MRGSKNRSRDQSLPEQPQQRKRPHLPWPRPKKTQLACLKTVEHTSASSNRTSRSSNHAKKCKYLYKWIIPSLHALVKGEDWPKKEMPARNLPWGHFKKLLAATYSPAQLPTQYHRRWRTSLPCSEWERVFPLRYGHQESLREYLNGFPGPSRAAAYELTNATSTSVETN